MPNITLQIDEEVLRKARKVAVDQDTTVTEMVREFLRSVAERDLPQKERALARLKTTFQKYSRDMKARTWTRDSLHER